MEENTGVFSNSVFSPARRAHKKACRRLLVNPPDKGTPLNPDVVFVRFWFSESARY